MANPTGLNAAAGDIARTIGLEVISRLNDSTGCNKGDIVHFDANGLAVIGVNGTGNQQAGFGVALEDGTLSTASRFAIGKSTADRSAFQSCHPRDTAHIEP